MGLLAQAGAAVAPAPQQGNGGGTAAVCFWSGCLPVQSGCLDSGTIEILVLCTGNICRSPVAEALLRQRLRRGGVIGRVQSAGLLQGGSPASEHSVTLLEARGLDLSAHRSQTLTAELLRRATLILGMAREHVREAVVLAPDVFPRTFTLKELVRRAERVGRREEDEPLEQWLMRVHGGRTSKDLMGVSAEDDVRDPIGQPRGAYVTMVTELDDLIGRLYWLAWGAAAGGSATEVAS